MQLDREGHIDFPSNYTMYLPVLCILLEYKLITHLYIKNGRGVYWVLDVRNQCSNKNERYKQFDEGFDNYTSRETWKVSKSLIFQGSFKWPFNR